MEGEKTPYFHWIQAYTNRRKRAAMDYKLRHELEIRNIIKGPKVIFITAEVSPIETDLIHEVLEEINVYYKYRFRIARLGKYK